MEHELTVHVLTEDYIFVIANDPVEHGAPVMPTAHPTGLLIAVCVKRALGSIGSHKGKQPG
jgi:hypothetical protein